jgi:hypothetical protein
MRNNGREWKNTAKGKVREKRPEKKPSRAMKIVYKYHIFLIHSSIVGYCNYFHSLVIINNAAINKGIWGPYCNLSNIPMDISLGVELLDHMAVLLLVFSGPSILFSTVVVLVHILTSNI